jgi:hypothetical protein
MHARMIAATQEDVPPGFQPFDISTGSQWSIRDYWRANPPDPSRPISIQNQARELLLIEVDVRTDATDTRKIVDKDQGAVPFIQGSYSGSKIGDFSRRSRSEGKHSAALKVACGNVVIFVSLSSRPELRSDAAAEVERLARLMVARADAAIKLSGASDKTLQVADKSITGQDIKGVGTVASVSDLAQVLGAKVEFSKTGDSVVLTANGKEVELVIGSAEAVLNGKRTILKFPSLRVSKEQVLCLVEPIAAAFGVKVGG